MTQLDFEKKHLAWCPKKLVEMCEEISQVVQSSVRDQVVYTMTSHQALCLDLRFGFVQRWTHMMAAPPQYGFTQTVGDKYVFSTHLRFRESRFWMKSVGKVQFAD